MEANGRKIEVFAPFGAAFDLTKLILFQPFDIRKWLAIGFAAFLAMLGGSGGGNGFNFNPGKGDWNFRSTTRDGMGFGEGIPAWLIPLLIFGAGAAGDPESGGLLLEAAVSLLLVAASPFVIGAAIRASRT